MSSSESPQADRRTHLVALVGNPNTGKTTLFNVLTGFRQHVGNYPGVTVDRKTGDLRSALDHPPIEIVDLPGAYSLSANSADEAVVLDVLMGQHARAAQPDLVLIVADASHLARNLFLVSQVVEIGIPVVVALNMIDLAESSGQYVDIQALAQALQVPVVPIVATKQQGIDPLITAVVDGLGGQPSTTNVVFPECVTAELDGLHDFIARADGRVERQPSRIELLQTLLDVGGFHERRFSEKIGQTLIADLTERRNRIKAAGESVVEVEARTRYALIDDIVKRAVTTQGGRQNSRTELVDRFLTHRVFGLFFLVILMGACFQSIYSWAVPIMDAIDAACNMMGRAVETWVPPGAFRSLLADGLVAGVGAVLVFLPQILILFLLLAILEDCGYMARAAFLLDRWMGLLGLNGKSFIPLMSSFACAIPGIMAARTIEDRRDRLVTIVVAPLMSCSARLPVYILLISAFVPAVSFLGGVIGLQALVLLSMYAIGVVVAVFVALLLKRTTLKGPRQPFLLELPSYKWPAVRTVLYRTYAQGKAFCTSAGTIIFAVTIVIWAMGYYPRSASIAAAHAAGQKTAQETFEEDIVRIASSYDRGVTAAEIITHGPVESALAAIESAEQSLANRVATDGLDEGSAELQEAREAMGERIAAIVRETGDAGTAAVAIHESRRALEVL
ncbi:MAG: ferrous iron transport protein B, partial [Planctomycetes bacterium]|nr:ferrous iron transport protein B [Planctomycetota bacterium]